MKKEIPQAAVYGILGVFVVGILVAAAIFFGVGGQKMSDEDVQRANMQAEVGNERLKSYIGTSPGGPASSPEALARQKYSQSTGGQ